MTISFKEYWENYKFDELNNRIRDYLNDHATVEQRNAFLYVVNNLKVEDIPRKDKLSFKILKTKEAIEEIDCGLDWDLFWRELNKELEVKKEKVKKDYEVQAQSEISQQTTYMIASKQENQATEMITEYIKINNILITTRDDIKSEVWYYDEGIYKPNGESLIKEVTRKIIKELYTPQRVNKIIAKIQADTLTDADVFFNTIYVNEIPVENGILDLMTLDLNPFTPEKIFFNKLPIRFNKDATCPAIEEFFKEVLSSEEDIEVIEELIGYCLYKNHFIEKAFMFVGDGRNGKGKTISLIKQFLGSANCCSVGLSQLNPSSTSVAELHGKLANLAGDLSNTSLKETGNFKEITGRDQIGAKRKYLRDLFFVNYSKQIFACNELPRVYDNSDGFWERWVLLDFPYHFVPQKIYDSLDKEERVNAKIQDPDIINKITTKEELSGLLNQAIKGLHRLLQNKDFSYTKGTSEIKNMWIRKSDSFHAFCMDHLENDNEAMTPKKVVRKLFAQYCKEHKLKGVSDVAIKARLTDSYGVVDSKVDLNMYGYGYGENVWEGVRIIGFPKYVRTDNGIEQKE